MLKGPRYFEGDLDVEYSKQEELYSDTNTLLDGNRKKSFKRNRPSFYLYLAVLAIVVVVIVFVAKFRFVSSLSNLRSSSYKDGIYTLFIVSDMDKKSRVESVKENGQRNVQYSVDFRY